MCENSIYKLEKGIADILKNVKYSVSLKKKNNLNRFLFRSELTEEWVVGAKRLGVDAAIDKESREALEKSINDKDNLHKRRHAQTALLTYFTECIRKNETPTVRIDNRKEKNLFEYYFNIFEYFEIAGIQKAFNETGEFKSLIEDNFSKVIKIFDKPVKYRIEIKQDDVKNKESILQKKSLNDKQKEGIKKGIEGIKNEISILEEILSDFGKGIVNINEKFIETIKDIEPDKNPAEFFNEQNGFKAWEIGSLYFSFPEFYKEMEKQKKDSDYYRLKNLNWDFVLLGMVFFNGVKSAEYFKNGLYILNVLNDKFDFIRSYIKKNKENIIKEFLERNNEHFAEFIFEYSCIIKEKPIDLLNEIFDLKIEKGIFRFAAKTIMNAVESSDIFETKKSLNLEKGLFEIGIRDEKYDNSLMFLEMALDKAVSNERIIITFLSKQLKYVFYKELKKISNYFSSKNVNKEDFQNEIYKQAIIASKIIAEYNTPKASDKYLGTIFANLLQVSFLMFESTDSKFYKDILNILMYKTPYKKVIEEINAYISIEEISKELENILNCVGDDKSNDAVFTGLTGIDLNKFLDYDEFKNNKGFLEELLNIKFMTELSENQSYEIFNDERGVERLRKDFEQKTENEILYFERIIRNKRAFDEISLENIKNIEDEINNYNEIQNWITKNLPFHYARKVNNYIFKDVKELKEIKGNIETNNEENMLKMYKDEKYKKHIAFLESWLGKRFLIPEVIKAIKNNNIKTKLSESLLVKNFNSIYLFITNPYFSLPYIFIPFVFYFLKLNKVAGNIIAAQISLTLIIIPIIFIFFIPYLLFKKIKGRSKDDKEKNEDIKIGLSVIDIFYPKMLGVIFIGFLTAIMADEAWAVALNSSDYFLVIFILYMSIIYSFLRKNITDTVGNVKNNKIPNINKRVFRILSVAILQVYLIAQFFLSQISKLMLFRAESEEILKFASTTVLNIPKNIRLNILMPDITSFALVYKEITFSPFILLNTMLITLLVGVVLQLYLSKEKIN